MNRNIKVCDICKNEIGATNKKSYMTCEEVRFVKGNPLEMKHSIRSKDKEICISCWQKMIKFVKENR